MLSIRTVLVCVGLLLGHFSQLNAEDRIFLFSPGATQISVRKAADLTSSGSIQLASGAFTVLATPDGGKYYVVRANATDTVAVVDPVTLNVTKTISLGTNASDAIITPDGKYLLVAAGLVRVFSVATDEEVSSPIPVGGAPTQLLVNNVATRAYVLAASGHSIQLIDLVNLTRTNAISGDAVGTVNSIALTDDDSRLVAVAATGLKQYSATNLSLLSTASWGSFSVVRGKLQIVPGSKLALVENGGSPPNVTSLLVGLDDRKVHVLGDIGSTKLEQITAVNETTAYAVLSGDGLVKIDITDPANPTITPVLAGLSANSLSLSPNRRFLFASSSGNSQVSRVELETNTITHSVVASDSPVSHASIFDPNPGPPAKLVVNGGNNQSVSPGKQLPVELSVRAFAADGSPVVGQQVLFSVEGGIPLQFEPSELATTNQRGIAAVRATVPSLDVLKAAQAALGKSVTKVALSDNEPPSSDQTAEPDPIQHVAVIASAGGVAAAGFDLNIVNQVGLVKLSGDDQIVARGQPFPLPITMLATDLEGNPLPAGTLIDIRVPGGIVTCGGAAEVDTGGLVTAQCGSSFAGSMQNSVVGGFIIADATLVAPELGFTLGQENFSYNVTINPQLTVDKLDGDGQSAPSGTKLPKNLRFVVNNKNGIPIIAQGGIGVNIHQVSGPPVVVEPRFLVAGPGVQQSFSVTLGPSAGTAIIEVQASAPSLPLTRFAITSTGGQAQRLEKLGDGQSGRTGSELPTPLQVKVFNESNQLIPFPTVTWTVLEGDASIVPSSTPTSGQARVLIGNTPGTIRIQARVGTLAATFVIDASPPQPVSISTATGQNQTLIGGVLSEPLLVIVNEVDNVPARGVTVTFSGPSNIQLHSLDGATSGNPLQLVTDTAGQAGVRAELVASAALHASPSQVSPTVTITASVGDNLSTFFVLNVMGASPTFTGQGVVNAASFQAGIVPGGLITIFGTGLSSGVSGTVLVEAGTTSYQGTIVRIGGTPAPLISITGPPNEQISVQAPFELPAGAQTAVQVENNGSVSTVPGIVSYPSQPGIFNVVLNEEVTVGALTHADTGALVTPDDPARHGEAVSLYFTGGGPISPAVQTGAPAPVGVIPLMSLPVVVGVDNKGSPILFSGYAPGFVGLYQVNLRIAADARCGLVPLNIRVGNVVSPQTKTAVACEQ
jgi:uncharacterized protein (TIGR03437 family)